MPGDLEAGGEGFGVVAVGAAEEVDGFYGVDGLFPVRFGVEVFSEAFGEVVFLRCSVRGYPLST